MKYWLDTEFIERPFGIDLISVGLVAEDGREFYAESSEVDWTKASQWTLQTVRPQLDGSGLDREEIGYAVRRFVDGDESPVFWGYFPAYDWVAFSWLFGGMDELPFHFPQLCLDIKQWAIELGDPDLPRQLARATTLSMTRAGQEMPGRSPPVFILLGAGGAALATKTLIKSLQAQRDEVSSPRHLANVRAK